MAIKERKQITGTTEQINAYAGHEGQIVWDKEKKTLVGMSGTAGTNYPLATQAYVDTQFLPLTGGNMTGEFIIDNFGSFTKNAFSGADELVLQVSDRANKWLGGYIALRGHSGSVEEQRGSFLLTARNKDGSSSGMLLGTPSGRLFWSGNAVLCVTGSGRGWVRYSDGVQICWGAVRTSNNGGTTVSFGSPFSDTTYVVNTTIAGYMSSGNNSNNWTCVAERIGAVSMNIWSFNNGYLAPNVDIFYTSIGYWTVK